MSLKKWFGSQPAKGKPEVLDVDDLITLQRYDEAEEELQRFLSKRPYDLRARQKLAELYKKTGRLEEAAKEYMEIADRYAREGFHDKALALLAQVSKLTPVADKVWPKVERLRRAFREDSRFEEVSLAPLDHRAIRSLLELQLAVSVLHLEM